MKRLLLVLAVSCSMLCVTATRTGQTPQSAEPQTIPTLAEPQWAGFDADRYREMDFVKPGAKTHIIGKIDNYEPGLGYTVVSVSCRDQLTGREYVEVADLDADGNFEIDVTTSHPQIATLQYGDIFLSPFLIPADTIQITTTAQSENSKPLYRLYKGGEAADINVALDSMADSLDRYKTPFMDWYHKLDDRAALLAIKDNIADRVRATKAYLERTLPYMDMSQWAKDAVYTIALLQTYTPVLDMELYHKDKAYLTREENGRRIMEPNPDYVPFTVADLFVGQDDYLMDIYDNPLALCGSWVFLNRAVFGPLFSKQANIAAYGIPPLSIVNGELTLPEGYHFEESLTNGERLKIFESERQAVTGVGPCFMAELTMVSKLVSKFDVTSKASRESLDQYCDFASTVIPFITHKALARTLLTGASDLSRRVAEQEGLAGVRSSSRHIDDASDVLSSILKPHLGKVVFVDVWAYWCGPCRGGIMDQKPSLKQFADAPFQVIYVAEDTDKEQCDRWLRENEIQGEHVYLSPETYLRLKADFNISGIPHCILIDKKGNVVDQGHLMMSMMHDQLQKLIDE